SPITEDGPVTKLTTTFGNRTRSQSSISLTAVRGLSLDGFMTIVQPAAKAGAVLSVNIARRKFQGVIAATTQIGFFHTCKRFPPVCEGTVSPYTRLPSSANQSRKEAAYFTSPLDSWIGFPISIVIISANSCSFSSIKSRNSCRKFALS